MSIFQQFKSLLLVQLIIGYIFIMSGLIATFLMLCTCIIWPFNRHLYRKICVHLAYSHWSQLTFLAQWWSQMQIVVYVTEEDCRKVGKEHVLCIMNHKYDIDWLVAWSLAERFQMLGNTKIYGKQLLKYVPLIGWAWYFTESIFLKREWEHDEKIIQKDLLQATDYPEGYYVTLLLFPEGTRFTEEKHKASLEICKAKGYPLLKHVLLPRPKGFITSIRGLRGHFPTILNTTVGFAPDGFAPTIRNVINGRQLLAHFHIERIPIDSVPIETDEQCAEWLRQLFKRKDDLYDSFLKNGRFPGPTCTVPRRINDLLMWIFWAVVTCVPLFLYLGSIFLSGTFLQQCLVVGGVVLVSAVMKLLIGFTEIHKGSSYGKDVDKGHSKKSE